MKPLHTSYSNLSSWRVVSADAAGEELRIEFDTRRGTVNAIAVLVGCVLAIIGLTHLHARKTNKAMMPVAYVILGLTGSVTPLLIVAGGIREKKKGPVLTYRPATDTMRFPRLDQTIESARETVHFSSEHYAGGTHRYELNVVIHGKRLPFISTNVSANFKPVTKALGRWGFAIGHQKIKG